ncbi:RecQ family ATP-dependent DNA helicase [Treponema sp.]|uniref:RecQ family ATP-dependent DNA helicase n=1 Tax=Treponema sp. TaxID=166 RepID=UPI003F09BC06
MDNEDLSEDSDRLLEAARKAFKIQNFYPWQRIVAERILDAANPQKNVFRDEACFCGRQIVLLPTGFGKSLCFLAPALVLEKPTLVIYPLLALVSDQKRRMDEGGISCVVFQGGLSEDEIEQNFLRIKKGAKVIAATPEILGNPRILTRLSSFGISHIAIDEAHCVSEWGDTFRPAYLELGNIIKKINPPAVTAFTATASDSVLARISEVLFDGKADVIRGGSDRPNIHYTVSQCYAKRRTAFTLALTAQKPVIIFCGTRSESEYMARELSAFCGKEKVRFYHAGMPKEEKLEVERWFYPRTDAVLCCTCAFGMGVDKKNIRTVIHLDPGSSAESYAQESGRGGRDGEPAEAILLWSFNDHKKFSEFSEDDRRKAIQHFAESTTCRRQVLLDALNAEQAACCGCDICNGKKNADIPFDAQVIMDIVRKNPGRFTVEELGQAAVFELNRESRKKIPVNTYEHSDADEIIKQLRDREYIRMGKGIFKGLVFPGLKNKARILDRLRQTMKKGLLSNIF